MAMVPGPRTIVSPQTQNYRNRWPCYLPYLVIKTIQRYRITAFGFLELNLSMMLGLRTPRLFQQDFFLAPKLLLTKQLQKYST